MLTRKMTKTLIAALATAAVGLVGSVAAAADEVVVYGDDVVQRVRMTEAEFQARMDEIARSLERDVKANVARSLAKPRLPEIRLAAAETRTRG